MNNWTKLRIICLFVFFLSAIKINALGGISRHYIIAFDVAYTDIGYKNYIASMHTRSCLHALLEQNGYSGNDYISVVSYAISLSNPDFKNFVTIAKDEQGKNITWRQYGSAEEFRIQTANNWYDIALGHHLCQFSDGQIASLQSLSKQYVIKTLQPNDTTCCDETILMMITDDVVNGVDDNYANEYNTLTSVGNYNRFNILKNDVFAFASKCNQNYLFDKISIKNVNGAIDDKLLLGYKDLRVVTYSVRPTVRPAIQAITDIPSPLPIKRIKGGYKLNLDTKVLSEDYIIKSLCLTLKNTKHDTKSGVWNLFIKKSELSDGDSLTLEMSVKYKDNIYNGVLISPKLSLYNQGLTLKQKYHLQQDTKILGVIPLVDSIWWWFYEDATAAVIIWDVIIIVLFMITICVIAFCMFMKYTRYEPQNKDIKLSKVNNNSSI